MNQELWLKLTVGGGSAAILLVLALSLALILGGESNLEDNSEPLDAVIKAQLQGTHLEFISETGRIVVNEDGIRQIIWDPPQLPTLEESIRMGAAAEETGDTDLLPPVHAGVLRVFEGANGVLESTEGPVLPSLLRDS